MDKELIERLAREAGYDTDDGQITMPHHHADGPADERIHLERFAALVAEECATVCKERAQEHDEDAKLERDERFAVYAKHERRCAAAIREKFCAKG